MFAFVLFLPLLAISIIIGFCVYKATKNKPTSNVVKFVITMMVCTMIAFVLLIFLGTRV